MLSVAFSNNKPLKPVLQTFKVNPHNGLYVGFPAFFCKNSILQTKCLCLSLELALMRLHAPGSETKKIKHSFAGCLTNFVDLFLSVQALTDV